MVRVFKTARGTVYEVDTVNLLFRRTRGGIPSDWNPYLAIIGRLGVGYPIQLGTETDRKGSLSGLTTSEVVEELDEPASTWHYKAHYTKGDGWHVVEYYTGIKAYTEAISPYGETKEELIKELRSMLSDLTNPDNTDIGDVK